jgi:hypothetical protein
MTHWMERASGHLIRVVVATVPEDQKYVSMIHLLGGFDVWQGYSLVVTHLTTNALGRCLNRAERREALVSLVLRPQTYSRIQLPVRLFWIEDSEFRIAQISA